MNPIDGDPFETQRRVELPQAAFDLLVNAIVHSPPGGTAHDILTYLQGETHARHCQELSVQQQEELYYQVRHREFLYFQHLVNKGVDALVLQDQIKGSVESQSLTQEMADELFQMIEKREEFKSAQHTGDTGPSDDEIAEFVNQAHQPRKNQKNEPKNPAVLRPPRFQRLMRLLPNGRE
jgi:hypothetical protein